MKIYQVILQSFKQRKSRTMIYIIGIILSTFLIFSMNFLSYRYKQITQGFYDPFSDYNQIVSRGSNYFQIVPVNSLIDEQPNLENIKLEFDLEPIPCLIIRNDSGLSKNENRFIMGIPYDKMHIFWKKLGLEEGDWPVDQNQAILGADIEREDIINIFGKEFDVSGYLNIDEFYSPLANIVVLDLKELQTLMNYENKVTLFFISNEIESDAQSIKNLENENPHLEVVTQDKLAIIQEQLVNMLDEGNAIITLISSLSSILFIGTMGVVKVYRKKDQISVFKAIGASNYTIFLLIWGEFMGIILIGFLLGLPITIISYLLILTFMELRLGGLDNFSEEFNQNATVFFEGLNIYSIINSSIMIIIMGCISAIIPALLAIKVNPLKYLKERN